MWDMDTQRRKIGFERARIDQAPDTLSIRMLGGLPTLDSGECRPLLITIAEE